MSHFVDTMAYVQQLPWHGLGTYVGEQNVDARTMQRAAQLEWSVVKAPVFDRRQREIEGVFSIERVDTATPFARVSVGARYEPLQNDALFGFAERLRTASGGELRWHTSGSLKGGRRVWALAQLAGEIRVERRGGQMDTSAPFLLLANSHDGSSSINILHTYVRVVCWNTLSLALAGAEMQRIPHTKAAEARLDDAANALGLAVQYFERSAESLQSLADTPMTRAQFGAFAAQLLTGLDDERAALEKIAESQGRTRDNLERDGAALVSAFEGGRGNAGADRYDALNSVTEWIDHQRGRLGKYKRTAKKLEQSMDSAQFGSGAALKRRAVMLLRR